MGCRYHAVGAGVLAGVGVSSLCGCGRGASGAVAGVVVAAPVGGWEDGGRGGSTDEDGSGECRGSCSIPSGWSGLSTTWVAMIGWCGWSGPTAPRREPRSCGSR